jgi:hypothetical protein
VTSRAKWAGFIFSAIAGSMVVPAIFKISIYSYIIFGDADMPAYFQFGVEYLLSRLITNCNYKVFSISFTSEYEFWLRVPFI